MEFREYVKDAIGIAAITSPVFLQRNRCGNFMRSTRRIKLPHHSPSSPSTLRASVVNLLFCAGDFRRGFTLLELLVAVALTAVMITVVAGAFAAGLRVWQRASQQGGTYQDAVMALELIQKDVCNTVPFRLVPFRGSDSMVEIPSIVTVSLPEGRQDQPGSIRYEYSAATRRLERVTRTFSIPEGEKEVRDVIMGKVESIRFSYGDRGPDGKGALSWAGVWPPGTNTPAAVKVQLRSPPWLTLKGSW